jgi:O-antigen/teichoic acid export membrane protein
MDDFSKNSLYTFFTEVFSLALGLVAVIIITRVLGPEWKGIYSLLLIIPGLLLNFGGFGIGNANVYFSGNKRNKIQDIVSNSLFLALVLGIFFLVSFGIALQFDSFQKFIRLDIVPSLCIWMVALSIPLSFFFSFLQNIIRGVGDIKNYNKARMLESATGLLAIFVFLVLLQKGLFGAVLSYVLSVAVATAFVFLIIKKFAKLYISINPRLLKESLIYGAKAYIANAISYLNYRLDMILIALLFGTGAAAAVGFYSISVAVAEKLFIIPGALSTVLFPKISSMNDKEASNFTPKVIRSTLFMVFMSSLAMAFLIKPLVLIFLGPVFLPSVLPFLLLLPGIIAFSVGGVIAADLSGRGKPQFAVYSSSACLIVNVALNIILIPKIGIAGAALASTVAYWADTFIVLIAFAVISKKPLKDILLIKMSDLKDCYWAIHNLISSFKLKSAK